MRSVGCIASLGGFDGQRAPTLTLPRKRGGGDKKKKGAAPSVGPALAGLKAVRLKPDLQKEADRMTGSHTAARSCDWKDRGRGLANPVAAGKPNADRHS